MKISNSTSDVKPIVGFVKAFLLHRYHNPVPVPIFHEEMWSISLSGATRIAFAAPRAHAKSTSMTHALTLYRFLFRLSSYGIIVSDTESQASQFLGDIKAELEENETLKTVFGVKRIIKDAITDIIVEMDDGYTFRIQSLGAEQKVRGRKWNNLRPDFIICDDLENDEIVESDDRREKFRNWFFKALIPSLAKGGVIVVVGTILHMDSVLMRLINLGDNPNTVWVTKLYRAHNGFDDFSDILWPEQWPEETLKEIRQEYIDDGFAEGYAQEYLNDPTAHSEAFFKKADFKPLDSGMKSLPVTRYAAGDLAISDKDRAAYTVFVIGELDHHRRLRIPQVVRFRGDANDIINTMIEIQKIYNIDMWVLEKEQIARTLEGTLYDRMNDTGVYLHLKMVTPYKDKRSRARAIQARMRAGGVYFDKEADWYPSFEQELVQFPKGRYKDQVDAFAWLGIAINELAEGMTNKEALADSIEARLAEVEEPLGRSAVTGY